MKQLILLSTLILITMSCSYEDQDTRVLTDKEKERIGIEIVNSVDNYIKAITSNDLDKMLAFWSDSEEFIHAGDGVVVGGYKE